MKYQAFTLKNIDGLLKRKKVPQEMIHEIKVVGSVLPFKTNSYVVNELIDWDHFETDPEFILNFPKKGMLDPVHYNTVASLMDRDDRDGPNTGQTMTSLLDTIRMEMNPHPAGQMEYNIPELNGSMIKGIQHKYRETMLVFPSQGQTCHAYCTFCFRWPQFSGMKDFRFSLKSIDQMVQYAKSHPDITDILFTGGDPMTMGSEVLDKYVDAILRGNLPNIDTIRIGTRSLSFWPYRYLTDKDSQRILEIFRKIVDSGRHLALMAHINHPVECSTDAFKAAVKKIRETGAIIRAQAPILKGINDAPHIWEEMWKMQIKQGIIPYYMFVPRNTGSHAYFSIPLVKIYDIFTEAYKRVSGVARTVRGPSMSALPGKIGIEGIMELEGRKVIVMRFIQGRDPDWVGRVLLAEYDETATWIDELTPAFGDQFFFEHIN